MAFKLAEAYVELSPRGFSAVNQAIAETKSGFAELGSQAQFFTGVMQSMAGNVLAGGILRLTGGVSDLAGSMLRAAADAETAKIAFEVMLGSGAKAQAMLGQLRAFAAQTPMTFPGLRENAKTLLSFQVAADQIVPTLKRLGDVSGGNAERMSRLVLAFGQISSAGRLQGQDLLQLINAGWNPLNEVSRKTGETMMELRSRMEAGKVGIEEIRNALIAVTSEGGMFHENLARQAETIDGLLAKISDNVAVMAETAGDSLNHAFNLKDVLGNSEKGLGALASTMKSWRFEVAAAARGMTAFATAWGLVSAAISVYTNRTKIAAGATAIFQSVLGGPAGIAKLLAGLAAAGIAVATMNTQFKSLTDSVGETKDKIVEATDAVITFYKHATGMEKVQFRGLGTFDKPNLDEIDKVLNAAMSYAILLRKQGEPGEVDPGILTEEFQRDILDKINLKDLEKGLSEKEKIVARIKAMLAKGEIARLFPAFEVQGHDAIKTVLENMLGDVMGFTKAMQAADRELNKLKFGDLNAQLMELEKAGIPIEKLNELRSKLEQIDRTKDMKAGEKTGVKAIAELQNEIGILNKTMTEADVTIANLRDQNVPEPKLNHIRRLIELRDKLKADEKRTNFFTQLNDDIEKLKGNLDPIDEELRKLAKDGASLAELERAGNLLLKKRDLEEKGKGDETSFVGFSDLNRHMQSLVGKPDTGARQVSLLERIAAALEASGRDAQGNPLARGAGGAVGAAGLAAMRGLPGEAGKNNPLAALGGENNPAAKLLGGAAGIGQGKGDQLLQRMGDLLEKNLEVLNKIEKTLTGDGIKVSSIPDMVARYS